MKGISLYCFQRQNSWYFRKRVLKQYTHHNKEISFKISLKKLLGNQNYYKAVLQGSLFTITNYLNNNIELFLFQKGKITLAELTDFCIKILNKYEQEALMLKNDFVNELGTRKKEIEEKRFASLDFYDENSRLWAGHTPQALDKEIGVLQEAYDSKDRSLLSKKAKDILNRQDILSKDELTQLEFLSLSEKVDFEEALVKKEIIVLNQDKLNYNAIFGKKEQSNSNGINEEKLLDLLAQHPDFKIAVQNIKAQKQDERDKLNILLTKDNLDNFFNNRFENLSIKTQENYYRGFSSMLKGLEQQNIYIPIHSEDKDFFDKKVEILKEQAETIIENRYIDNVENVISNLYEDRAITGLISQCQYELSIRQEEAFELISNPLKYIENGYIENLVGKGNHIYEPKEISLELEQKLLNNTDELISKTTYYYDLQKYDISSHDFRFTSARDKFEEKVKSGISEKEAKLQISSELNHKREAITDYYLKRTE